jgi:hypothetical protein
MRLGKVIQIGALLVAALFAGTIAAVCVILWQQPKIVDFVTFWAAGRMVLGGHAAAIYDIAAHHAVERSAVPDVGNLPFAYPPPFALLVAPFALLPFGAAFTGWLLVTGALYFLAARRWMRPRLALAHPVVLINGFIGQTGFLTSALLFAGCGLLASTPFVAGALFGALVIKPQLGLMIPVALVAGRQWRAIGGAAMSSAALLAVGWFALGTDSYRQFFAMIARYPGFIAANSWPWHELASVFALFEFFAAPRSAALAVHSAVVVVAAVLLWRAWRHNYEGKEAMLAAATVLAPPYVLSYDTLVLALPTAWLLQRHPSIGVAVWLFALIPVGAIFGFYEFPNTIPLAALLCLVTIYRSNRPVTER